MTDINPAFIQTFVQVAKAYDFIIEFCDETGNITIKSKDRWDAFYWVSTEGEDVFWNDLKLYFYDQGYNTAARW